MELYPDYKLISNNDLDDSQLYHFQYGDSLRIGTCHLEGDRKYTGCTVFYFPNSALICADVRGGSPGFCKITPKLVAGCGKLDAIVFTGGSLMGLSPTISGINKYVLEQKIPNNVRLHSSNMPNVSGSVIYDWIHRKDNLFPTFDCGYSAITNSVSNSIPVGDFGAGTNAHVGKVIDIQYAQKGGQGAYCSQFITEMNGQLVRGNYDDDNNEFISSDKINDHDLENQNTTLTFVSIDRTISSNYMVELTKSVHTNIATFIRPFATAMDGDILYLASTNNNNVHMSFNDRTQLLLAINQTVEKAIFNSFKHIK